MNLPSNDDIENSWLLSPSDFNVRKNIDLLNKILGALERFTKSRFYCESFSVGSRTTRNEFQAMFCLQWGMLIISIPHWRQNLARNSLSKVQNHIKCNCTCSTCTGCNKSFSSLLSILYVWTGCKTEPHETILELPVLRVVRTLLWLPPYTILNLSSLSLCVHSSGYNCYQFRSIGHRVRNTKFPLTLHYYITSVRFIFPSSVYHQGNNSVQGFCDGLFDSL